MKIYLVGGAVRDKLLHLPVKEQDWVVVGAKPTALTALGYSQVGKAFPVFLHPKTKEEYALARTEKKIGAGYKGFEFHADPSISLEADLKRRDLTINAMAEDENGVLIDPYGGQQDLKNRVLRHVSDAFVEDPLRVLRVARFYARFAPLGFTIAQETWVLMRAIVRSLELSALTPDRVWLECEKALVTDAPEAFFEVLRKTGGLKVLFPEIHRLFGVPNPPHHHPEIDTGVHTLMVLKKAAGLTDDPAVRFAALAHDLGKGLTPPTLWPRHIGHEAAGQKPLDSIAKRYPLPRRFYDLALLGARYHCHFHRAMEMTPRALVRLFESLDVFRRPERLAALLLVGEADSKGRLNFENSDYPQKAFLMKALAVASAVSAKAIVDEGYSGVAVGQVLKKRRIAAVRAWLGTRL